jgi:1-acyl-sn-glycerol-3-phosphate acyltransferase
VTAYGIAKVIVLIVGHTLWRLRVYGTERVPASGGLVVACNHISNLDPPLLGASAPRPIRYMAKKELFEIPVLGPLIRALGAFPVDRQGSATAAIKRSVEVIRAGDCVGIFPEGGRNVAGDKEPRIGVALVASLADAPVVPAYVHNSGRAGRLAQIKVVFGEPMQLALGRKATREDLAKFTEDVMDAIRALGKSIDGDS